MSEGRSSLYDYVKTNYPNDAVLGQFVEEIEFWQPIIQAFNTSALRRWLEPEPWGVQMTDFTVTAHSNDVIRARAGIDIIVKRIGRHPGK